MYMYMYNTNLSVGGVWRPYHIVYSNVYAQPYGISFSPIPPIRPSYFTIIVLPVRISRSRFSRSQFCVWSENGRTIDFQWGGGGAGFS